MLTLQASMLTLLTRWSRPAIVSSIKLNSIVTIYGYKYINVSTGTYQECRGGIYYRAAAPTAQQWTTAQLQTCARHVNNGTSSPLVLAKYLRMRVTAVSVFHLFT